MGSWAAPPALAGAWPMPEGELLVIVPFAVTRANEAFDSSGEKQPHNSYRKAELAPYLEYGWTRRLTLVSSLAFTHDETDYFGTKFVQHAISRIEAGPRLDLGAWNGGQYAIQTLAIYHGATTGDDAFSARRGDVDAEIGLYNGRNFTFLGMGGFSDTYAAYRFRAGGTDEMKFNVTVGLRPFARTMLLVRNENFASTEKVETPEADASIAAVKLGLSVVREIGPPVSLELGFMRTVAGNGILEERCVTLALWYRF